MSLLAKTKNILSIPTNSAIFASVNLLLGVGPIIVPEPFFEAGFILSFLWTGVVFALSLNSAYYVGESIEKIGEHLHSNRGQQGMIESLIENADQQGEQAQSLSREAQPSQPQTIKTYDHTEQFSILYGQKWKVLPAVAISIYLFGVSVSKCIMTGKTLSKVLNSVPVLNTFEFWLAIFFVSGAAFSFKSIEKTKGLQIFIVIVRAVSILLMLVGAIIIMIQNGRVQSFTPDKGGVFNLDYFPDLFSNLVFSLLYHHSLPGITRQLAATRDIKHIILWSFIMAGTILISIPITAIMAFGNDLIHDGTTTGLGSVHKLIYYNEDFKGKLDFVYYIVSFYVFLNVAAFSIYVIVIRNNIINVFMPAIDANRFSKATAIFSIILLGLILLVSWVLKNEIQVALSFTGGIFGCVILLIIPSLEVYRARRLVNDRPRLWWLPFCCIGLGVIFMVFNLYKTIQQLVQ